MSLTQYGSVRDPNKQENNIQYRTYFRNGYNQNKNNGRNNYRSITEHEGEQQRYNRNSRQDRSNNMKAFQQVNTHNQIMNQIHRYRINS